MGQMIPKKAISVEHNWQKELAMSFTDPIALLEYLQIDPAGFVEDAHARTLFPMRVPRHFAALMEKGNPDDPLLQQVLPRKQEFHAAPGYSTDPLDEHDTRLPGLLHKYQSRVLVIVRGGCAVNCRYCFRRHFPYADNSMNRRQFEDIVAYLSATPEVDEVILSGGDPLMAKDDFLAWLVSEVAAIPHIRRLRIHTRLPVVLPERLDNAFTDWFTGSRLSPVMVLHINHANEVSPSLKARLSVLRSAGVTLLNQAVLLNGINASADAQVALSDALFDAGVMPYYLHVLDKVQGASHFAVSDDAARQIMAGVIKRLPGYLVPKLVREIGGQPGKTPVDLRLHP
ncbi:EF-P beta-lysylation protein EpmB [Alteromonas sp. CYL-A6]|uniref:EF-P beta-lysylation protein EpmB n=1 Tax=Alteromonas nitratireducens TaxID=3390813 RepID=UPI0034B15CEF